MGIIIGGFNMTDDIDRELYRRDKLTQKEREAEDKIIADENKRIDASIWKKVRQMKLSKMTQKERDAEDKRYEEDQKKLQDRLKLEKQYQDRLNLEKQKEDKLTDEQETRWSLKRYGWSDERITEWIESESYKEMKEQHYFEKNTLKHLKKFSFSNISDNFDEHIHKSIRGYDQLRDDIVSLSKYFVVSESNVYDLGCSQGTMIKRIRDTNTQASDTNYYGIDINPSFSSHWKNEDNLSYIEEDIRGWKNKDSDNQTRTNSSFMCSMFTMQFIDENDRVKLLDEIYNKSLRIGGALILCEKVFSPDAKFQNMMDFMYMDYKSQFFSEKELLEKEQELRHLAKLQTEEDIINNLKEVGFKNIQIFWRNFNFIGLVAIKKS